MAKDYYLVHHGILGQKWGIRRFQNKDGSYTAEGRKRYGFGEEKAKYKSKRKDINEKYRIANANILSKKELAEREQIKAIPEEFRTKNQKIKLNNYERRLTDGYADNFVKKRKELQAAKKAYKNTDEHKIRTAIGIGATIIGGTLATYGTYKVSKFLSDQKQLISLTEDKRIIEKLLIPQLEANIKYGNLDSSILSSYTEGLNKNHEKLKIINETIDNISKKHLFNFGLTTTAKEYDNAINTIKKIGSVTTSTLSKAAIGTGKAILEISTELLKAMVS